MHVQQSSLDAAMGHLSQRELDSIGVGEAPKHVVTATVPPPARPAGWH